MYLVCDVFFYKYDKGVCLCYILLSKISMIYLLIALLIGISGAVLGYKRGIRDRNLHSDSDLQEKEEQNPENSEPKMITLNGNSHKDSLKLFPQELLYIESSGNYVHIYYIVNERVLKKSFLATLLKMEETLQDVPFLVRCHRAFIVNLCRIEKMNGSKMWLKSTGTEIPVSRTYKATVKKRINSLDRLSNI